MYTGEELGFTMPKPIVIKVDASAVVGWVANLGGASRMKSIDIRKTWVQTLRDLEIVELEKVDGLKNKADTFTKIQEKAQFEEQKRWYTHALKEQ